MFYWLMKYIVIGPISKAIFRPWIVGRRNVPAEGGAILASNHLSFVDSVFLPLMIDRPVSFLAKSDYFTGKGLKGWATRMFMKAHRADPDRPLRRQGLRGIPQHRSAGARARRPARDLPRGHPQPRRPALPRPHRASRAWRSRRTCR